MAKIPTPLSEKSIQKMLAGRDMKTVELIRKIYASLANLYGICPLWLAWDLLKRCGIKVKQKDFYTYSDIARREMQPYYIFEEKELFNDGLPRIDCRFIVNRVLFRPPFNNDGYLYLIAELQADKLFPYVPDNLFDFYEADGIEQNPAWKRLCMMIRSLKTKDGKPISEPDNSDLPLKLAQTRKAEYLQKRIEAYFRRPLADRVLEDIKLSMHSGENPVHAFADAANVFQIEPSKKQAEQIVNLITETNNTSNLWANFGWKPEDLRKTMQENGSTVKLSELDPEIRNALTQDVLDFKEIQAKPAKAGITLLDE